MCVTNTAPTIMWSNPWCIL